MDAARRQQISALTDRLRGEVLGEEYGVAVNAAARLLAAITVDGGFEVDDVLEALVELCETAEACWDESTRDAADLDWLRTDIDEGEA